MNNEIFNLQATSMNFYVVGHSGDGVHFWIPHLNNNFVCHVFVTPPLDCGAHDEYFYKSTTFCTRLFVTGQSSSA